MTDEQAAPPVQPSTPPAVAGNNALMSNEDAQAAYKRLLDEQAANLKNRLGQPSGNVIRTKGKIFTLPDGSTHPGPMRAVILDFKSFNSYFEGQYNPNNPQKPACYAVGDLATLTPSAKAPNRQADACAGCPMNQWGTAPGGGKGKACKNQYKLALIPADMETPDPQKLYTLNVSPTGMKAFDAFVRAAAKNFDALPLRVAVDIGFDPNQAYPTLTFGNLALNDNLGVALSLMDQAQEMLMREPEADAG